MPFHTPKALYWLEERAPLHMRDSHPCVEQQRTASPGEAPVTNAKRTTSGIPTSGSSKAGPGRPPKPPAYAGPSPFSSLLAEFMWNSRDSSNRPLGVGQLAIRLGLSRHTVNTWVHRNALPDVDTLLRVLRTLNIPVARLLDYYRAVGLPVPPLTDADAAEAQERTPPATTTAPAPAPRARATKTTSADLSDPWEATITATTDSLRQLGIPEAAIAATVANIRATQAGEPHSLQRHVTAEHAEPERESEREGEPKQSPRGPHSQRR